MELKSHMLDMTICGTSCGVDGYGVQDRHTLPRGLAKFSLPRLALCMKFHRNFIIVWCNFHILVLIPQVLNALHTLVPTAGASNLSKSCHIAQLC